jgi:hypothetical protein
MTRIPGGRTEYEGPLAEFVALRQEIERRSTIQHQLLTLQLTLSGAVFGFSLSDRSRLVFLLVLPISTYMLLGRLASQHAGIAVIGTYIREVLNPKVPGGLEWENWIIDQRQPTLPVVGWLEPLLVNFPGVACLALAWVAPRLFFDSSWDIGFLQRVGLIMVWFLGLALLLVSVRLLWHVRRRWWLRTWRDQRATQNDLI